MPLPKPSKGESKNDFIQKCMSNNHIQNDFDKQDQKVAVCMSLWKKKKSKASLLVELPMENDERIFGENLELTKEEIAEADMDVGYSEKDKKPYGDVPYADNGFQKDGKKRYPIDTEEHIRAAWNYINKKENAAKYSSEQVSKIKAKIVAAWKKKINKDGPPSAEK